MFFTDISLPEIEERLRSRLSQLASRYELLRKEDITLLKYGRGAVAHELIKAWLVEWGEGAGYAAWPEYRPRMDAGGKKIDVVYLKEGVGVVAGFEIDKGVKGRSAAKLCMLPSSAVRCVISFGSGTRGSGNPVIAEKKAAHFGLHRIDLTEARLPDVWGNLRRG